MLNKSIRKATTELTVMGYVKMSPDMLNDWRNQVMADPLDGRQGRMGQVAANLKNRFPFIELRDLSPIMDELRSVKSPAEITLLRKAGELTGMGALAAMKATKPDVFEYHLNAPDGHLKIPHLLLFFIP